MVSGRCAFSMRSRGFNWMLMEGGFSGGIKQMQVVLCRLEAPKARSGEGCHGGAAGGLSGRTEGSRKADRLLRTIPAYNRAGARDRCGVCRISRFAVAEAGDAGTRQGGLFPGLHPVSLLGGHQRLLCSRGTVG